MTAVKAPVGARLGFDGKRTSWLVRAETPDGRYSLATAAFGRHPRTGELQVCYTIIDWREQVRGAMNVIGGGLGIFTIAGPDPEIDEAIEMLQPGHQYGTFEVSRRNRVPLHITRVLEAAT